MHTFVFPRRNINIRHIAVPQSFTSNIFCVLRCLRFCCDDGSRHQAAWNDGQDLHRICLHTFIKAFDLAHIGGGPNPGFGPVVIDLGHSWLIERRGLANRSDGLGRPAWPIKLKGWGAGVARALSIKVKGWRARVGLGFVDENEKLRLGRARAGQ